MMSPFKWKLSACTFTWCYLFFQISQNEIWKFGRNLLLAKFGSETVKRLLKMSWIAAHSREVVLLREVPTIASWSFMRNGPLKWLSQLSWYWNVLYEYEVSSCCNNIFFLFPATDLINNLLRVQQRCRFTCDKSLIHAWLQVNNQHVTLCQ